MMYNVTGGGMMWGMGFPGWGMGVPGLIVLILLVLAVAALLKYLISGR